jgi:hypothetical protein
MWTPEHRRAANRNGLRYPSDLTDAEWTIVEPMIPACAANSPGSSLGFWRRNGDRTAGVVS